MLSIEMVSAKLRFKIKQKIKIITTTVMINTAFTITTGITFLTPLFEDINISFALFLFYNYFPNQKQTLEILYRMTTFIFGYLGTVHVFQLVYYSQHLNFQIEILMEFLKYINKPQTFRKQKDFFHTDKYQTEVKQTLKFCIKRSLELIE